MTVHSGQHDASTRQFCAHCGGRLVSDAHFCSACGESVAAADGPPIPLEDASLIPTLLRDGGPFTSRPESEHETPAGPSAAGLPPDEPPARGSAGWVGGRLATGRVRFGAHRRRWLLAIASGVVILLVAGATGAYGYRYLRDQPTRRDILTAQREFVALTERLGSASDLEQVSVAGSRAGEAAAALEAQQRSLHGVDTSLGRSGYAAVSAEVAVARAAARLQDLAAGDVRSWGATHEQLARAMRTATRALLGLQRVVPDAPSAGSDLSQVMSHLEEVVGSAVAATAQTSLVRLLGQLGRADSTTAIRAVATRADKAAATARASFEGVAEPVRAQLRAAAVLYDALGELVLLDGDHLQDWGDQRVGITEAIAGLDGDVGAAARDAIRNVDAVVRRAQTVMADWRQGYKAAVQQKAADGAALERYRSRMDALMHRYSGLRQDLADWIAIVDDPTSYVTWDDAFAELSDAEWERQKVLDAMNAVAVPQPLQDAHAQLVGVIDDGISAVRAASSGLSDAQSCTTSCYYKDTPGWRRFTSESSRISAAYGTAVQQWQSMVEGTALSIKRRQLPAMPRL